MCNSESATGEHVPPDCFFPSGHKLNLITVPSCSEHNLNKSKDDEYVRSNIAPSIGNNLFGLQMASTKVNRSFKHSTGLVAAVFKDAQLVKLADGTETGAVSVNLDRWNRFFEHLSNAIYFHDFRTTHPFQWEIFTPNFKFAKPVLKEESDPFEEAKKKLLSIKFLEQQTSNPEIFRYFFFKHSSESYVYKYLFYENFVVSALSKPGSI